MDYTKEQNIISSIYLDIFSICVVISIIFLIILLAIALFYSIYNGSIFIAVYFAINIVMCVLRIVSRIFEGFFKVFEVYYFDLPQKYMSIAGIVNSLVLILLDSLINALLIGGILIITHSWFSTAIMLWFQRRDQLRRYLPSLFLFLIFVFSQLIGLTLTLIVAAIGFVFAWRFSFFVMEIIHFVTHIVLYLIIVATFLLLGALIRALLTRLKHERNTGTSTFKKGEMARNDTLSRKIVILATAVALFFFIGASLMSFRILSNVLRVILVANFTSDNVIIHFIAQNYEYGIIYMLVTYYTLYIGIFEFGLTGFITIYYLLTPDEGLTQMPLLSEIERRTSDYRDFGEQENDFFDPEERVFHILEDETIKDMQINDEEEEKEKRKSWRGKKKKKSVDQEELAYPLEF